MPSSKDVATACGVCPATVLRAFAPDSVMRPSTRERILRVATEMGYTPNNAGRILKSSRSQTIGYIIPADDNQFYFFLLKHLETIVSDYGYHLMVRFIHQNSSVYMQEKEIFTSLSRSRPEAVIFSPNSTKNEEFLKIVEKNSILMQCFLPSYPNYDSVVIDDFYGVEIATKHLLDKGHHRIMYLGVDGRVNGLFKAYSDYGIPYDPELIVLNWFVTCEQIEDLILKHHPTAIIALPKPSVMLLKVLTKLNLKFPDDISLIMIDDSDLAEALDITVIAPPLYEVATKMIGRIMERIQNPDHKFPALKQTTAPFLIERGSVNINQSTVTPIVENT